MIKMLPKFRKKFWIPTILIFIILYLYFNHGSDDNLANRLQVHHSINYYNRSSVFRKKEEISVSPMSNWIEPWRNKDAEDKIEQKRECIQMQSSIADIETYKMYQHLDFKAKWISSKKFWNKEFEKRYKQRRKDIWPKLPLKVIIVPHSHNDPGWLKTYEGYFESSTKNILDMAVDKLTKYKDLSFVWTEISFLSMWWEKAHLARRLMLVNLLKEKRFEILTGAWVMTDEANGHFYALLEQLIAGHQWLTKTLNYTVKSSWSVDSFGYGSTFPYILQSSGIHNLMIMRIHYAWKEFFARTQSGDFWWQQSWQHFLKKNLLCHNFPYDIYAIENTCGPFFNLCSEYNFAYDGTTKINSLNVESKALRLLESYGRTGSLYPHNVVLVPLGNDFSYESSNEWEIQYSNYKQIMKYVNERSEYLSASIHFGTVSDYFKIVRHRQGTDDFPRLQGDFFVYADVFSDGYPAFWNGYYTTRPYFKRLSRRLQSVLRQSEICYALAMFLVGSSAYDRHLDHARRTLGLFQHHDAITGTSKAFVMHDYGLKLFSAIKNAEQVRRVSLSALMSQTKKYSMLLSESANWTAYYKRSIPVWIDTPHETFYVIIYNAHSQGRINEVIYLNIHADDKPSLCVFKTNSLESLMCQLMPFISDVEHFFDESYSGDKKRYVLSVLLPYLPPLSVTKLKVSSCATSLHKSKITVFHKKSQSEFKMIPGVLYDHFGVRNVNLGNVYYKAYFDTSTMLLSHIKLKQDSSLFKVNLSFSSYVTDDNSNGAYLFRPASSNKQLYFITSLAVLTEGPIYSKMSVMLKDFITKQVLYHTLCVYHYDGLLAKGISISNVFGFTAQSNTNADLVMRFDTDLKNTRVYTDSNAFQFSTRVKVDSIGLEGNVYPITSMVFIEDDVARLSLAVNHAHGASCWVQGRLEVVFDRRALVDDDRGLGEGVLDNYVSTHNYWLILEQSSAKPVSDEVPIATFSALQLSQLLDDPLSLFYADGNASILVDQLKFLSKALPSNVHLLNLRSNLATVNHNALMILHKQSTDCNFNRVTLSIEEETQDIVKFRDMFRNLPIKSAIKTGLTGLPEEETSSSVWVEQKLDDFLDSLQPMTLDATQVHF